MRRKKKTTDLKHTVVQPGRIMGKLRFVCFTKNPDRLAYINMRLGTLQI